jgi:hypothetical protein
MARRARLLAVVRVHRTRSYDSRLRRGDRRRQRTTFALWSLATRTFALRHSV